jgi:aerobic-type carbon monoxide dehydrogenase small subunit (CoxS/CutS family)
VSRYALHINGRTHDVEARADTPLLAVLRDGLDLTGTRFGCGQGACGACYVLADGRAVASCLLTVEDAAGRRITTIEGLAGDGRLHPVQQAFLDEDAMQCGYCTSGIIMSAVALLTQSPHPSDDEVREALAPHLCRCGVYERVLRAVRKAQA